MESPDGKLKRLQERKQREGKLAADERWARLLRRRQRRCEQTTFETPTDKEKRLREYIKSMRIHYRRVISHLS